MTMASNIPTISPHPDFSMKFLVAVMDKSANLSDGSTGQFAPGSVHEYGTSRCAVQTADHSCRQIVGTIRHVSTSLLADGSHRG